jgi:4-hydroxyphenylacetate 3-monooxygenase
MMHLTRDLCGGQICLSPDASMFDSPEVGHWMEKYYAIGDRCDAGERRALLAFARDLLNSDSAGHRLTFQLFAQSPPFAHLAAVYRNFDFEMPRELARQAARIGERELVEATP